jgi:hypothetical protein
MKRALVAGLALAVVTVGGLAVRYAMRPKPATVFIVVGTGNIVVARMGDKPLPGRLVVNCNVPCTVSIDTTLIGKAPVELNPLTPGKYQVDVVANTLRGRGAKTEVVEIVPAGAKSVSVQFLDGKLSLTTKPPGVEVALDGAILGHSPLTEQPVIEGEHELTLSDKKKGLKVVRSAVVKAGETTVLDVKLSK